ncbi:phosphopantetheine-binding protein [Streptomyces sp. NPDC057592]|uniref:phosphopantetheine-binding protein n=2 Tax=unclassified Streptomyces TaxID=2593676 RepID=UPI00369DC51A
MHFWMLLNPQMLTRLARYRPLDRVMSSSGHRAVLTTPHPSESIIEPQVLITGGKDMATRQEVIDAVAARIRQILPGLETDSSVEKRDLRDFAEFDSLSILESLVWLENEFSVKIPDEELIIENFSTVGKMVDYVLLHQSA